MTTTLVRTPADQFGRVVGDVQAASENDPMSDYYGFDTVAQQQRAALARHGWTVADYNAELHARLGDTYLTFTLELPPEHDDNSWSY